MSVTRRVFVSMPADHWLSDLENEVKWGIVDRIESLGNVTESFFDPSGRASFVCQAQLERGPR